MNMEQKFLRMTDKAHKPVEDEIMGFIGEHAKGAWLELEAFIRGNYDMEPETIFYGKKYGWTVRYRKSGKTLCSLFPEKGGFAVLITLGNKESEEAFTMKDKLSSKINELLRTTEQLRDGRWLWFRQLNKRDVHDIEKLLLIKKKPTKPRPKE